MAAGGVSSRVILQRRAGPGSRAVPPRRRAAAGARSPAGMQADGGPLAQDPLHGHDTYETVKFLNRGAYGVVVLARERATGREWALKFIERGPLHISRYVHREVANHMKLRHPHVVALHEVFLTRAHLVLVMEYAAGGDLFSLVRARGGLEEGDARWFFQQIAVAIDYCHKLGVCSRDIKLENTLLDGAGPRPLAKLCDFGFSKDANHHSAPGSTVGTPAYLAPEVISAADEAPYDGAAADVWSLGVLLYVMACGAYPFRRAGDDVMRPNARNAALFERIRAVEYSFPEAAHFRGRAPPGESLKGLVRRMLVADPAQRATLAEVMQHPWFTEGLSPGVRSFNDGLVRAALAEPVVSPAVEAEIAAIVSEARGAGGAAGPGGAPRDYGDDEVDELLRGGSSGGAGGGGLDGGVAGLDAESL